MFITHDGAGDLVSHRVGRIILGPEGVYVECATTQIHNPLHNKHPLPGREIEPIIDHATYLLTAPTTENIRTTTLVYPYTFVKRID